MLCSFFELKQIKIGEIKMSVEKDSFESDMSLVELKMKALRDGKTEYWKPAVGNTNIRILPKLAPQKVFWTDVLVHFINKRSYKCLKTIKEGTAAVLVGTCVACDLSKKLLESEDSNRQTIGANIESKVNTLVNIATNHGTPDALNKVWTTPMGVMQDLLQMYFGDYRGLDHPVTGVDMLLNRTGEGKATRYKITPRRGSSKTTKDLMKGRKDLSKVVKEVSSIELKKAVLEAVNNRG